MKAGSSDTAAAVRKKRDSSFEDMFRFTALSWLFGTSFFLTLIL